MSAGGWRGLPGYRFGASRMPGIPTLAGVRVAGNLASSNVVSENLGGRLRICAPFRNKAALPFRTLSFYSFIKHILEFFLRPAQYFRGRGPCGGRFFCGRIFPNLGNRTHGQGGGALLGKKNKPWPFQPCFYLPFHSGRFRGGRGRRYCGKTARGMLGRGHADFWGHGLGRGGAVAAVVYEFTAG